MATPHPEPDAPTTGRQWRTPVLRAVTSVAGRHWEDHPAPEAATTLFVRQRHGNGVRVLELCGESDIASVPLLQAALDEAAAGGRGALVVDVSALTFCDVRSAALVLRTGRTVRTSLAGAHGVVERVFDLIDTSHELARCDNAPAAEPT